MRSGSPSRDGGAPPLDVVVRPMRRRDVSGFVELRHGLWADDITTA